MKKVGICLPVYNAKEYIRECLSSIIHQTYLECYEYSVDDCSEEDQKVRANISLPFNLGWSKAMNLAADMAIADGCDYIFLMNADDYLAPDCIEKLVERIESDNYAWVNCWGKYFGDIELINKGRENCRYADAWGMNPLPSFALFKADIWKQYGGYDTRCAPEGLKWGYEDWDLWLRLLKDNQPYSIVEEPLYFYRTHKDQAHHKPESRHTDCYNKLKELHNIK